MYTSLPTPPTIPGPAEHPSSLRAWLADVGHVVDEHGITHSEAALAELGRAARSHGLGGGALDALADVATPTPARMRAFSRVGSALIALRSQRHDAPDRRIAA